jgi:hypothetical protein
MHLQARRIYVVSVELIPSGSREGQTRVIERQRVERHRAVGRPARPACLVAGCSCKDARIVSHRRAAFFAAWAKDHGETADRVVTLDAAWSIAFAQSTD